MQRASDVPVTEVNYLWERHVPAGMISLWGGKPGQGKSLATCLVAADVSQKAPVLFSTKEDALGAVVVPRLRASGADMDNVLFSSYDLPRDMDKLESEIIETGAQLVVMDPVAAHVSTSIYDDQGVRRILSPMKEMVEELDCAVLMVTHTVKPVSKSAHPLTLFGGTGGLVGVARLVHLLGTNPKDMFERLLVPVKSNLGPLPGALVMEVDDDGDGEHSFITRREKIQAKVLVPDVDESTGMSTIKRECAAAFLTNALGSGGELATSILRDKTIEAGMSWASIKHVAEDMGLSTGNRTWVLPPAMAGLL